MAFRSLTSRSPQTDSVELERRIDLVKVNAFPHSEVYILVNLISKVLNNHQITWNTLYCAITALSKFLKDNAYGTADFEIYDGQNKVGEGFLTTH